MDDKLVSVIYGSLLHDIGKLTQRAEKVFRNHGKHGADWLYDLLKLNQNEKRSIRYKDILDSIRFHMAGYMKNSNLDDNSIAYITYFADNITAGIDRREVDFDDKDNQDNKNNDTQETDTNERFNSFNSKMLVADIYSTFEKDLTPRYYRPQMLRDDNSLNLPQNKDEIQEEFGLEEYKEIKTKLEEQLRNFTFDKYRISSLISILEATLSSVPSSTNKEEISDISLFDHLKLTGAISSCMFLWLKENNKENKSYKELLFSGDQSKKYYEEPMFRLLSFDISGIQSFIYTIQDKKAAKTLRARSFYLEILTEYVSDKILSKFHLSRANLLYTGGGHGYMIVPNTKDSKQIIEDFEIKYNNFLIENFGISLFVAIGSCRFKAKSIMEKYKNGDYDPEEYNKIFRTVSTEISKKKIKRYRFEQLKELNSLKTKKGRECKICKKIDDFCNKKKDEICDICNRLEELSDNIIKNYNDEKHGWFIVSNKKSALPIGPNAYLDYAAAKFKSVEETLNYDFENDKGELILYSKNKFIQGFAQGTRLLVGDYAKSSNTKILDFGELAEGSEGIERLGVLRLDVDNLGTAFIEGFSKQENGKYNTLTRTATLSRSLALFFKYYINYIAKNPKCSILTYGNPQKQKYNEATQEGGRSIQIIYSGGDDVFAVGSWNDIIEFSVDLNSKFKEWTNGKLEVSAGVGIFHKNYPISSMARLTGELEDVAKDNNKNSICLFEKENVFKWDEFVEGVLGENEKGKFRSIKDYFEFIQMDKEKGKTFLYKLLSLIRNNKKDKISTARFVYALTRAEPKHNKNGKESECEPDCKVTKFLEFKDKIYEWFKTDKDRKQLECAINIYIYSIREKENK